MLPQTHTLLKVSLSCTFFLKITKLWSRWSWRVEVQQWDTFQETHRVALDWLFDRMNLDPKIQNQICWHNNPTRWHTDKGKLHTWWMESSSSIVEHNGFFDVFLQPSYPFSLWSDQEQYAMSKRVQESNLKEGSAVAKPKPMNLNLSSMRKIPSQERSEQRGESKFGPQWCPSPEPETVSVGHWQ